MSIKKRIMRSNILSILIPTVIIIIISAIMYISYAKVYTGFNDISDNDPKKILQAGQLIKTSANQMEYAQDDGIVIKLRQELADKLHALGYDLRIESRDGIVFSSLTKKSKDAFDKTVISKGSEPDFFTLESDSVSFIQKKMSINNQPYYIQAVNPDYVQTNIDFEKQMLAASHYIIIVLVISFIIILVTNIVISANVTKRLVAPLDLLSYGAEQIKEGNLDFEIRYDDDDEFGEVCDEFNKMRVRLKESIQTQIKYEEDRKELIAGISHDLRTPLTSIKGYIKGIQDGVANTPEKLARYLDITYMQACNMDNLVDKLFLFSTLDTGRFPFRFEKANCNEYLQDFVQTIGKEYESHGLSVAYEDKTSEPLYVMMDAGEMSRVLGNILDNSVKYSKSGKNAVKVTLTYAQGVQGKDAVAYGKYTDMQGKDTGTHRNETDTQRKDTGTQAIFAVSGENAKKFAVNDENVKKFAVNDENAKSFAVIEVEDNGVGVAQRHIPHLFKSFFRADPSRANASRSSGLGLSIADRIISAHGGNIFAENRDGLCIIIMLPVVSQS